MSTTQPTVRESLPIEVGTIIEVDGEAPWAGTRYEVTDVFEGSGRPRTLVAQGNTDVLEEGREAGCFDGDTEVCLDWPIVDVPERADGGPVEVEVGDIVVALAQAARIGSEGGVSLNDALVGVRSEVVVSSPLDSSRYNADANLRLQPAGGIDDVLGNNVPNDPAFIVKADRLPEPEPVDPLADADTFVIEVKAPLFGGPCSGGVEDTVRGILREYVLEGPTEHLGDDYEAVADAIRVEVVRTE